MGKDPAKKLSAEMMLEIFSHLDPAALGKAAGVSKTWNSLAEAMDIQKLMHAFEAFEKTLDAQIANMKKIQKYHVKRLLLRSSKDVEEYTPDEVTKLAKWEKKWKDLDKEYDKVIATINTELAKLQSKVAKKSAQEPARFKGVVAALKGLEARRETLQEEYEKTF